MIHPHVERLLVAVRPEVESLLQADAPAPGVYAPGMMMDVLLTARSARLAQAEVR